MLQKKIIFDNWDNYLVKVTNEEKGKETSIEVNISIYLHPLQTPRPPMPMLSYIMETHVGK